MQSVAAATASASTTTRLFHRIMAGGNRNNPRGNTTPLEEEERWLEECPLDVNGMDDNGNTPLCFVRRERTIRYLVRKGANVNHRGHWGNTPLHWACDQLQMDVIRVLLECGADPNSLNDCGNAPLHFVMEPSILLPNTTTNDNNNTTTATTNRMEDVIPSIIRLLVQYGARRNTRNRRNETPLMVNIQSESTSTDMKIRVAHLLCQEQEEDNTTTNADTLLLTPFIMACYNHNYELVQFFLRHRNNSISLNNIHDPTSGCNPGATPLTATLAARRRGGGGHHDHDNRIHPNIC